MIPPWATGDLGRFFCRILVSFRVLECFDSTSEFRCFFFFLREGEGVSVQNNTAVNMQPGVRDPQVWSAPPLASQLPSIISSSCLLVSSSLL